MKKYFLFACFITSFDTFTQVPVEKPRKSFQVYQVDKDTDISQLKAHKNYLENLNSKKHISKQTRDGLLGEYLTQERLKTMDELDKDLFIKRVIFYTKDQFFKEYNNSISSENYNKLKDKLEGALN